MCYSSLPKSQLTTFTRLFLLCRSSVYLSIHEALFRALGITISDSVLCACSVECTGTSSRAHLRKVNSTIDATRYPRDIHIKGNLLVQELKQVVCGVTLK